MVPLSSLLHFPITYFCVWFTLENTANSYFDLFYCLRKLSKCSLKFCDFCYMFILIVVVFILSHLNIWLAVLISTSVTPLSRQSLIYCHLKLLQQIAATLQVVRWQNSCCNHNNTAVIITGFHSRSAHGTHHLALIKTHHSHPLIIDAKHNNKCYIWAFAVCLSTDLMLSYSRIHMLAAVNKWEITLMTLHYTHPDSHCDAMDLNHMFC